MHFTKDAGTVTMEFRLDEGDNPVIWTCVSNGNPAWVGTQLRWEITDLGDTRSIDFRHTGFTMSGPPYESTVSGWEHFAKSLAAYLDAGAGEPWS